MTEQFFNHKFTDKSRRLIKQVNEILEEYKAMGYDMTLRQIYYQLVARDLLPNTTQSYKRLVNQVTRGREAGLIPWSQIIDRTRRLRGQYHVDDVEDALADAARTYLNDLWENQDWFPLVLVEKEALAGIIGDICDRHDIPWVACRGYPSASIAYRLGKLLRHKAEDGKLIRVLHLGDLDPSGWDMSSDLMARLIRFGDFYLDDSNFELDDFQWTDQSYGMVNWAGDWQLDFFRLALNQDQIDEHQPPPNPAKSTDSRFQFFLDKFGRESWELDALAPPVLDAIITKAVDEIKDHDQWESDLESQETDQEVLANLSDFDAELIEWLADLRPSQITDALNEAGL